MDWGSFDPVGDGRLCAAGAAGVRSEELCAESAC